MITEKPVEELVAIGARLRTAYLLQQFGYTIGIAADDEEGIEEIVDDPQLIEEIGAMGETVKVAAQDRELMEQEAKDLKKRQDVLLRKAKVWRRKVAARAARARHRGKDVPEVLCVIGPASTVPAITAQLTVMTATFATHIAILGGERAQALLEEGKAILTDLSTTDAEQEVARLTRLPQKVREFYVAKAKLYLGIKIINDAGRELHAEDPKAAAAYNLKILHRRR